jgi:anti-anti-sigma factor
MPESMEIVETSPVADTAVLRVIGRLDAKSAPQLERRGVVVKASGRNLVLNLQGVTFVASSGLGALLALVEEYRKTDRRICFACLSSPVKGVVQLLNLESFLTIHDSEESAVEAMSA